MAESVECRIKYLAHISVSSVPILISNLTNVRNHYFVMNGDEYDS